MRVIAPEIRTPKRRQVFSIVRPSWAISIDSIATSLPSAFKSVPVIFVGKALFRRE